VRLHPHDFSPTIRSYADAEVVTLNQLAFIGGISRTQVHRQYHGAQPQDATLRRWAEGLALPSGFRAACTAELERRQADIMPRAHDAPEPNLDFNRDGRIDRDDLAECWHRKADISENRRHHAGRAIADHQLSDDELAEDERLRHEEETLGTSGTLLLRRLARHG
jgi:hypothetical protein